MLEAVDETWKKLRPLALNVLSAHESDDLEVNVGKGLFPLLVSDHHQLDKLGLQDLPALVIHQVGWIVLWKHLASLLLLLLLIVVSVAVASKHLFDCVFELDSCDLSIGLWNGIGVDVL